MPSAPRPSFPTKAPDSRASLGAFFLSLIVHCAVLLMVGGYVVFQGVVPSAPFTAVPGTLDAVADDVVMPEPEDTLPSPELPAVSQELASTSTEAAAGDPTSADILVSTAPSLSFNLPPAIGAPTPLPRLGSGGGGQSTSGTGAASPTPTQTLRSLWGTNQENPNALVGTFYDIGRERGGRPRPHGAAVGMANDLAVEIVRERGNPRVFRDSHSSPTRLFASLFVFPRAQTAEAYGAFGEKPTTDSPAFWVHYTGRVIPPSDGRYRFTVWGDDHVIVLVDGRPAAIADNFPFHGRPEEARTKTTKARYGWETPADLIPVPWNEFARMSPGEWIDWRRSTPRRVDIFIGDSVGAFVALIAIEEEGKKYDRTPQGLPILPPFKVDRMRIDRATFQGLFNEGVDFDSKGGPVFQVVP